MIFSNKKIILYLILSLFFNSCVSLTGINKDHKEQKINKKISTNEYSINDVKINIVDLNSLAEYEIEKYNKNKVEELNYKVNEISDIYDYKYEYILGAADSISIDLTDTDDLDNTYLIDQYGMIDLPFIGKVQLEDLTLSEAQNILMQIISDYYKNPDVQLEIQTYNSSKVHIVGAVRNQITINLDQKPIKLIEAAIQANFNPNAEDKLFGTKGFLRRDGRVYKIDLTNAFIGEDDKENL